MKPTRHANSNLGGKAKLTYAQAMFIRDAKKRVKAHHLADYFGVSAGTIYSIWRGVIYRDLIQTRDTDAEYERLKRIFKL